MATSTGLLALFFLLLFCFAGIVTSKEDCVYTVYVRTGSIIKGGTDSNIGLKLYDSYGYGIYIKNLELWGGLMGPDYNYYERDNLDIFSGKGPCLEGPVCAVNLTSDGSGPHHGWYCNYVEVTSTGVHIPSPKKKQFKVKQWLATDTSPYELSAVRDDCPNNRDYCPDDLSQARHKSRIVESIRSWYGSGSCSRSDFSVNKKSIMLFGIA